MKRLLLIAACLAFLAGCTKEDNVVRQKANLATKATQAQLNIQFMSFGNTLNFYIPEWDRYELTRVAITLYNVYIWPGAESPPIFNTSTWQYVTSQVIIAEASLSENALIHLTPESYMDANSVNIRSNGNYSFAWTVTGINTGSSGSGGGDSGGGTNPPGGGGNGGCDSCPARSVFNVPEQ